MIKTRFMTVASLVLGAALAGCGGGSDSGSGGGGGSGGSGGGASEPPKSFVLVHGAFMGAWGWDSVEEGLSASGADVTVVELPAHGQDETPVQDATLDAYVGAVGDAVDAAATSGKVVLVGHSMAGMVISAVAEKKAEKIDKLVYLAAYLPKDGQSLQALAAQDKDSHLGPALTIDAAAGVGKLPADKLQDIFCADCTAEVAASIQSHYRDEPLAPLATPVQLSDAIFGEVPKFYIYAKQDNAIGYALQQSMTGGVTLAGTATLDASHSPFLSDPDVVVSTLLGF